MNNPIGVPLSSDQIPAGTGLIQSVECLGIKYDNEKRKNVAALEQPVIAQVTTFANGMRRVCCPNAVEMSNPGDVHCGKILGGKTCIYAWEDPSSKA